jgi:hypothetical protein
MNTNIMMRTPVLMSYTCKIPVKIKEIPIIKWPTSNIGFLPKYFRGIDEVKAPMKFTIPMRQVPMVGVRLDVLTPVLMLVRITLE